jgi:hypothetical protein
MSEACELEWSPKVQAMVRSFSFENRNYRWKEYLSAAQQRTLTESLGQTLKKYGYD